MLTQREFATSTPGVDPALDPGQDELMRQSLNSVLGETSLDAAMAALATVLAQRLGCRRVAVGWAEREAWRIRALSHGAHVSERARLHELLEAMQESAVQGQTLCIPRVADGVVRITLAHRALMRQEGLGAVLTVPLALRGQMWGAITCEREQGRFMPGEIIAIEAMLEQVVPLLCLQHQAGLGAWPRWRQSLSAGWQQQGRRGRMVWRLASGGVLLALAGVLAWPMPRQLPASARVEGALQRVMTAPMDGYLQQVTARPGDVVRSGQVLAQLADEDLQLQVRALQADVAQHDNAFVDAFTRGERAEAAMAQARAMEARAQLERAQQQLSRTRLVAPFEGVVISGDLSQRLGAPLQRSDVLFTLAPLDGWRLVLEVDERQIAEVQAGQQAQVLLAALPEAPMRLRVTRVTPLARSVDGRQRFEVLAEPDGPVPAGWRPGMQGVAQIKLAPQPLSVRWAREAGLGLRWMTWSWW